MTTFQKAVIVLAAAAFALGAIAFATVQVECSIRPGTTSGLFLTGPTKPDSRQLWESCE